MSSPEPIGSILVTAAPRIRGLGPGWIWSRGRGLPVWLGPAQLRVWRELELALPRRRGRWRDVGLRELARALEINPGSLAAMLSRFHGLGLLEHVTLRRGRLGGIRLTRVLELVRDLLPLDGDRRARALARVGIPLDGAVVQLALGLSP